MDTETKFRVWDKDRNEMYYLTDNTTENNSIMDMRIVFDELGICVFVKGYGEEEFKNIRNFKLMQYTGLKDMNGKEIYEGDIVEYCNTLTELSEVIVSKVIYRKGCFGIEGFFKGSFIAFSDISPEHIKIVGNVYEKEA
ncbi:hypothetical protein CLPU_57c00010 [Gottschalkia purinilytica]|uniref:YopX protein domain-containing protein n=1 Tax=Gottschalkia purinilytica TaxID=1503 RepID=A0A0L0W615_GOTPU|nr:YopX family protein [Gottschalkia purinilytica]KNF06941.1 hypothetical protein CLPU_57c00010 [Gottschalkia purinilytica]